MPELGVTIVRFANGVEGWFKPTDFKNDQVLFSLTASGGASLATPDAVSGGDSWRPRSSSCPASAGTRAVDLQKLLAGKIAGGEPVRLHVVYTGISGSSTPGEPRDRRSSC